ncbi:MAG: putative oxidoreductase SadH [Acidimicrobiales bacterium]|nr:MAG: SDR family NAD(P)-dependent oxidoreductase [Actinomycetota bacterium]MBV6509853.1 putative oxidoreductase SadH [Acidimicrobiales bacterium]RIK06208.1 MAG: short-chain dehydrogenase [Acidobacteriota bacterium]
MAFNGRVAFVTGAGSGIGQLAARQLAGRKVHVAAVDVDEGGLKSTAEGLDTVHTQVVDVTDLEALCSAVKRVEAEFGPIDRVYNCAAIMPLGLLTDQDPALVQRMMEINYGGLVNVTHAVLPSMLQRKAGDFISFCSMAGHLPAIYMGAYNASKSAVATYTEVLYHENLRSGVRFVCVCPPVVNTPLLQQGRDTVWPKILDETTPIEPQVVLDAIEAAFDRGDFWVMPGRDSKTAWWMRRLAPEFLWRRVHKLEGR